MQKIIFCLEIPSDPFPSPLQLIMLLVIGASLSEPHIDGTCVRDLFICMVRPSPALRRSYTIHCERSKIFRAIETACCNVCMLHCASVQHTLPRVQAMLDRRPGKHQEYFTSLKCRRFPLYSAASFNYHRTKCMWCSRGKHPPKRN